MRALPILDIPTDQPRQKVTRYQGASAALALSANTCERVLAAAHAQRMSLYNYLLTAFILLLHRNTRQQEYIVGIPIAAWLTKEREHMTAPLVNVPPLHLPLDKAASFSESVQTIRGILFTAFRHQRFRFTDTMCAVNVDRNAEHFPIYQCMFQLDGVPLASPTLDGINVTPLLLDTSASQVDISLSMRHIDGCITGTFEYNARLCSTDHIQYLVVQWKGPLDKASSQPMQLVRDLIRLIPREHT